MQSARHSLAERQMSVSEVAVLVGYQSDAPSPGFSKKRSGLRPRPIALLADPFTGSAQYRMSRGLVMSDAAQRLAHASPDSLRLLSKVRQAFPLVYPTKLLQRKALQLHTQHYKCPFKNP